MLKLTTKLQRLAQKCIDKNQWILGVTNNHPELYPVLDILCEYRIFEKGEFFCELTPTESALFILLVAEAEFSK